MKKAIIIPAYLRFSHPDALATSEGFALTKRAIQSLEILNDRDHTLILLVSLNPAEGGVEHSFVEMDQCLRKEIKALRQGKTFLFSNLHLSGVRGHLKQAGFKFFSPFVDLQGFSNIRNTGLLLAYVLSMEVVIFIDNDEVVEDPHYLQIACEHLNEPYQGKRLHGKGGFYLDAHGDILLSSPRLWWRCLWNKTKWMNEVWKSLLASTERFLHSPILLGGNLVLHRELYRQIPFDPYIPRGEDTDYLINAHQKGFCILFDKALKVKHLHPPRTGEYFYEELRGDIERFLYEREKVSRGVSLSLDPYPGYFLRRTLYLKAFLTALLLAMDYFKKRRWKEGAKCFDLMSLLLKKRKQTPMSYVPFCAEWGRWMANFPEKKLDPLLESCWV